MAVYMEEEEAWKCPKHPSKRRRSGVCPTCLRLRLGTLCPDCHHPRPCSCAASSPSSSSSSGEPSFRRSRSVAAPFLRFRNPTGLSTPNNSRAKTPLFLSVLKRNNTKRSEPAKEKYDEGAYVDVNGNGNGDGEDSGSHDRIEDFARMVTRSRSVNVGNSSAMASGLFRRDDAVAPPRAKVRFWHFASPFKVFRSLRTPKVVVRDRSPLQRV